MARILYQGPSDDAALVKRFEDEDIDAALAAGWRLKRKADPETEVEPVSDRNPEPVDAPEPPAADDTPAASNDPEPPAADGAEPEPEDTEPESQPTSRRSRGRGSR